MLRLFILFTTLFICLISCNNKQTTGLKSKIEAIQTECKNQDVQIKSPKFLNTEIETSVFYNDATCKIKRLKVFTLLDERSGSITSIDDFKGVSIKCGKFNKQLSSFFIEKDSIQLKENKVITFNLNIEKKDSLLDTLDFLMLETLTKNGVSYGYFYKNSKEFLEIEKTYLDYGFFSKNKISILKSYERKLIKLLSITVKVNEEIDDITSFKFKINDYEIDFRDSIMASFENIKREDKGCKLINITKLNKEFLKIDIDIEKLKINNLKDVEVYLNNVKYAN